MTNKKIDQLIHDCYVELYKNSTPSCDFDQLVKEAKLNERGQKIIPFDDYEISNAMFWSIVNKYASLVRPKYKQQMFKNTILLGCSPKTKE